MPNSLKSSSSGTEPLAGGTENPLSTGGASGQGWLRVGAIAAASAVVGGLAAAWFYRKTLSRLREAGDEIPDSLSEITENETEEDF